MLLLLRKFFFPVVFAAKIKVKTHCLAQNVCGRLFGTEVNMDFNFILISCRQVSKSISHCLKVTGKKAAYTFYKSRGSYIRFTLSEVWAYRVCTQRSIKNKWPLFVMSVRCKLCSHSMRFNWFAFWFCFNTHHHKACDHSNLIIDYYFAKKTLITINIGKIFNYSHVLQMVLTTREWYL